jgi:rhodanese-related sulfurtransferase
LAEAAGGGYRIITTEDLAEAYRKDPAALLLVDTRQEWEYRTGHMQGALNFSMEPTWWSRWRKAGPLESFLGPDRNRTIVFY